MDLLHMLVHEMRKMQGGLATHEDGRNKYGARDLVGLDGLPDRAEVDFLKRVSADGG